MRPTAVSAAIRSAPPRSKANSTSPPSPFSATVADKPPSNATASPGFSFLAGRAKARQRSAATLLCRVTSMPAAPRRPNNRAGITRVSLKTRRSPGRSSDGSSRTIWSRRESATSSRRAESRGTAGRSAISAGGRSKSKSLTFMGVPRGRPIYAEATGRSPVARRWRTTCGSLYAADFAAAFSAARAMRCLRRCASSGSL